MSGNGLLSANQQFNASIGENLTINIVHNFLAETHQEFQTDFTDDDISLFEDPKLNALFIGSLRGTDTRMSRFATYFYRDRFHCTKEKQWYQYVGHGWTHISSPMSYKEALATDEFLLPYQKAALHFEKQPLQTNEIKRKAQMVRNLCIQLEGGKRRDRIVEDSMLKFHNMRPKFVVMLNSQNIAVFENGVYNFDTMTFGPGNPDVPVTLRMKQPYIPYDPDNENVKFLENFLAEILPNAPVRHYALEVMGICLTHDTPRHLFILTGAGANGKSRLMALLEECLGDRFQMADPAMLTKGRELSSWVDDDEALLNACLVVFQNIEADYTIQESVLRTLVGAGTTCPRFKTFLVCNSLPKMPQCAMAISRRIHFPTTFVKNPLWPHERKVDYDLDDKLTLAAPHFTGLLVHHLERYKSEGLSQPDEIFMGL